MTTTRKRRLTVAEKRQQRLDAANSHVSDALTILQELRNEITEIRDNLEEHFAGTERYETANEQAEMLESIVDDLESLEWPEF